MPAAPVATRPPDSLLRRLYGPRFGLPMLALGVAAMLPARLSAILPMLADGPPAAAVAAAGTRPILLGDGVVATPTTGVLLSGPSRVNPVGDERVPDVRVLAEMRRRQAEAEKREREVELREARLNAAETMVRSQMQTLSQMRSELEQLASREGEAASSDIDALVALYSNMRPQQAAKVFDRLEASRAAVILLRIPDRQAGPILAQMDPQSALAVTQEIAGRREAFRR